MSPDRPEGAQPETARIETRKRPSIIWLVPLVALAVAAWLAYDTLSKRGPLMTVTFQSGEGLVAGQSLVKYKDVTMGHVQSVNVSDDLTNVVVTARINKEDAHLLTDQAKFWVVKPRLFAGNLSGLDTVLSGSYIAILPST